MMTEEDPDWRRRVAIGQWMERLGAMFPQTPGPNYNPQRAWVKLDTVANMAIQFCDNLEDSQAMQRLREHINYYERDCPRDIESIRRARRSIGQTFVTMLSGDYGIAKFRRERFEEAVIQIIPTMSRWPVDEDCRNVQELALEVKQRFDDIFMFLDRAHRFAIREGMLNPVPGPFAGLQGMF